MSTIMQVKSALEMILRDEKVSRLSLVRELRT